MQIGVSQGSIPHTQRRSEHKIPYEGRCDKDPLTQADECRGLAREDLITCLQRDRRVEIEASIQRKHAIVQ